MNPPRTVHVLGAGVAGAAVAFAFARRGARVTVYDPHRDRAASCIPAAVVRPRLWLASGGFVPDAQIVRHAFDLTLRLLDEHRLDGFHQTGVLLCGTDAEHERGLRERAANPATADVARFVERDEAERRAGVALPFGGAWIERGGWCDLSRLTNAMLDHPGIEVLATPATEPADLRVIATGLLDERRTSPVRGQAIALRWPHDRPRLRAVLCTSGYLVPARGDGTTWLGATFDRGDDGRDLRPADDDAVRRKFDALPDVAETLARADVTERFAAVRFATRDRLPIVGPLDEHTFATAGHGSRGAITAPLAAELLAAAAFGEPPPLPAELLRRLAPR